MALIEVYVKASSQHTHDEPLDIVAAATPTRSIIIFDGPNLILRIALEPQEARTIATKITPGPP